MSRPSVVTMVKRGQDVSSISLTERRPGLASLWATASCVRGSPKCPICTTQVKELEQVDMLSSPVGCLSFCIPGPTQHFVGNLASLSFATWLSGQASAPGLSSIGHCVLCQLGRRKAGVPGIPESL